MSTQEKAWVKEIEDHRNAVEITEEDWIATYADKNSFGCFSYWIKVMRDRWLKEIGDKS